METSAESDNHSACEVLSDINSAFVELRSKSLMLYSGKRLNYHGKNLSVDDYLHLLAFFRGRPFFRPLKSVRESLSNKFGALYIKYILQPLDFKTESENWQTFLKTKVQRGSLYDFIHQQAHYKTTPSRDQNVQYCSNCVAPLLSSDLSAHTCNVPCKVSPTYLNISHATVSAYFNTMWINFSESQKAAVVACIIGRPKNVWIYGAAGSGKSKALGYIIYSLRKIHGTSGVVVAAMQNNIASVHAGITIHSWLGLKLLDDQKYKEIIAPKGVDEEAHKKIVQSFVDTNIKEKLERLSKIKVLIIDEATLLSHGFFLFLNYVCQYLKQDNEKFFGGVQVSAADLIV